MPRALHRHQRLELLITDAWVGPGTWSLLPGDLPRRLSERFHPDLASARVRSFTASLLMREAAWRWQHAAGWDQLIARNRWFGSRAAAVLREVDAGARRQTMMFAHSYSALDVFRYAKWRGWTTVLGQIDPGIEHFRIVRQLAGDFPEYGAAPSIPPDAYFDAWREECALADWIVVNSEWSRDALVKSGTPLSKLRVVPLPFEPEAGEPAAARGYPDTFTLDRPLRALFVGHAAVAKGVHALLEAVDELRDVPVELTLVGAPSMVVPARFANHRAIRWVGAVPRLEVMRYYRDSDVLVFPSMSDGFGMAQIEASASRLPIIASRSCGRVVVDGVNGVLLPEVTPTAIAHALRAFAANPRQLEKLSAAPSGQPDGVWQLGAALLQLESAA